MSIVAVGTVFPLVFAIQAAFAARSQAIRCLGQLKARMMYLYFQSKAWDAKYKTTLAGTVSKFASDLGIAVIKSLNKRDAESTHVCYDLISELMATTTDSAEAKIPAPLLGVLSTTFQQLLMDLEGVQEVRDNETPKGLRKFAIFLICVTPITLAPYWSHYCSTASGGELKQVYTINEVPFFYVEFHFLFFLFTASISLYKGRGRGSYDRRGRSSCAPFWQLVLKSPLHSDFI